MGNRQNSGWVNPVVYSATTVSSYWPINIRAIRPVTPFLGSGFSRRGEAEGVHTCACFDGSPSNIILSVACRRDDDALYANCTLEVEPTLLKQLPEPSNVIRKKVIVANV